MSLGKFVLSCSRSQFRIPNTKDTSSYLLRSPIRRQDVRGFRTKKEIIQQQKAAENRKPPMLRHYVYAGVTVPATFCGAMIWQYENVRMLSNKFFSIIGSRGESKTFGFRENINNIWNSCSQGQRMMIGIISANLAVFLLWRAPSPAVQQVLSRYFLSGPGHPVLSSTLSAFSHRNFLHLFLNMYALWSFTPLALSIYGKEQFLAVYLSGATISSVFSMSYKNIRGIKIPSLGASGAILTILASVCYNWPESRVAIAFIDKLYPHSFSCKSALIGLMIFDAVGLLLRFSLFDHAAHLSGVLFGLLYMRYGKDPTWQSLRKRILQMWIKAVHRPKKD